MAAKKTIRKTAVKRAEGKKASKAGKDDVAKVAGGGKKVASGVTCAGTAPAVPVPPVVRPETPSARECPLVLDGEVAAADFSPQDCCVCDEFDCRFCETVHGSGSLCSRLFARDDEDDISDEDDGWGDDTDLGADNGGYADEDDMEEGEDVF